MKGKLYPTILWEIPFQWDITRDQSIEFHDEPNKKMYQCLVTHPALPHWGFREVLTHKNGVYSNDHNSTTYSTQKKMGQYMTGFAQRSFHRCWKDRFGTDYDGDTVS